LREDAGALIGRGELDPGEMDKDSQTRPWQPAVAWKRNEPVVL
jgi:hypothetical protein